MSGIDPATEAVLKQVAEGLEEAIPKLVELFSRIGGRDAFFAWMDEELAKTRAANDTLLASKVYP